MTFPATPLDVTVELFYDAVWNDITAYVLDRDGEGSIEIDRGLDSPTSGSVADPQTCTLSLNNRDGRFAPKNRRSPLFGKIGRNTQLRVIVTHASVPYTRFTGEVSDWPVHADLSGRDVWVPVTASGVLRRLGQRRQLAKSPLRQTLGTSTTLARDSYWPMEEGVKGRRSGGTWGSAISERPGLVITSGQTQTTLSGDWAGSLDLPRMGTAIASARCALSGAGTAWTTWVHVDVPTAGVPAEARMYEFRTTGTARTWQLWMGGPGLNDLRVVVISAGGTTLLDTTYAFAWEIRGRALLHLEAAQDGADIDYAYGVYVEGASAGSAVTGTLAGQTCGRPASMEVGSGNLGETGMGHVFVATQVNSLFATLSQLNGYNGELTDARVARLAGELGVPSASTGVAQWPMGVQRRASLVDLLADCADVDGVLTDRRFTFGLFYRTRLDRVNPGLLTLDYAAGDVSVMDPVDDDALSLNDSTVARIGGASARVTVTSGPMSLAEPPSGIGPYEGSIELNLASDLQAPQLAHHRAVVGTQQEFRLRTVGVNLARDPAMIPAAAAADVFDMIVIDSPPTYLPPGPFRQSIVGYTERMTQFGWRIDFRCVPQAPYDFVILNDPDGIDAARLSPGASTLSVAVDAVATSLTVTSTVDSWVTTALHPTAFPFKIRIEDEVMTVTAISGTGPWTFTVTRGVAGYSATHGIGAVVALAVPRLWS